MTTSHTPGPWSFENHSPAIPMLGVYASDGKGPWHHERSDEEKEANSRLAAAAPDLLDALKYVENALPKAMGFHRELDVIRAAINKATGA